MKKLRHLKSLPSDAVYDELESPVGVLTMIYLIRFKPQVLGPENYH
jgi:hypothetical protein